MEGLHYEEAQEKAAEQAVPWAITSTCNSENSTCSNPSYSLRRKILLFFHTSPDKAT